MQPHLLSRVGLAVACALACNSGTATSPPNPTRAADVTEAADAGEATSAPSDTSTPTATSTPPKEEGPRYASADGTLSAPQPDGEAWECLEQTSEDPPASLIKCRQRDRARFFFMMAKEYSVPANEVRSLDGIISEVLPQTYAKLFTSYSITRDEPTMVGTVSARDLWIDAEHASMGSIRKRERLMVQGERVFVVSAEGLREVFEEMTPVIDRWFAGAAFTHLK
ncbi:MAG: hypothetical protein R3B09_24830 [Nannocystaceae bacterium]